MWFDSMDPRDPLQLTDGVWGGLFRYYFPNNTTLWLWSLYGNDKNKGWEILPSSSSFPEIGGRVQIPIPKGEGALSYHFREADASTYGLEKIAENRFGLDVRSTRPWDSVRKLVDTSNGDMANLPTNRWQHWERITRWIGTALA